MKILVIGGRGQLGSEIYRVFSKKHDAVTASRRNNGLCVDITKTHCVEKMFEEAKPHIVINCASMHDLRFCEENPLDAFEINALGVRDLALMCEKTQAKLVQISTDYVFGDGHKVPIQENARPNPLNIYGMTKLCGENFASLNGLENLIVRTSELFGHTPCAGRPHPNFVERILDWSTATRDGAMQIVDDQFISPTFTADLAMQILKLVEENAYGVYHATSQGECSWYEFARAILSEANVEADIVPITSQKLRSTIRRSRYSVLANYRAGKIGIDIMPKWRNGLGKYFATIPKKVAV